MNQKIATAFQTAKDSILIGVDGYIDEVWQPVFVKENLKEPTYFTKLRDFASYIAEREAGGLCIDIAHKRRVYGGFTANTANALMALGAKPVMLGLYGDEIIDPVFQKFEKKCTLINLGTPRITTIMEFQDGKLMLTHKDGAGNAREVNWQTIVDALGEQGIRDLLSRSDIMALGYWASMLHFDDIVTEIAHVAEKVGNPSRLFFDFADIARRSEEDLIKTMSLLAKLNERLHMTLSLNEHEAARLFKAFHVPFPAETNQIEKSLVQLRKLVSLDEIIVHTPYIAVVSQTSGSAAVPQIHCDKTVRTTGAGDTFNGGYLAAYSHHLDAPERLAVANTATRLFVRDGDAPGVTALLSEL